jgi:hypothetical protein
MKSWLGAIAISMVVSPALAQNHPSSEASVQKYQDLKWEKINPEMGSKSAEIAVLHVPYNISNRNDNTYAKRHACTKALA